MSTWRHRWRPDQLIGKARSLRPDRVQFLPSLQLATRDREWHTVMSRPSCPPPTRPARLSDFRLLRIAPIPTDQPIGSVADADNRKARQRLARARHEGHHLSNWKGRLPDKSNYRARGTLIKCISNGGPSEAVTTKASRSFTVMSHLPKSSKLSVKGGTRKSSNQNVRG